MVDINKQIAYWREGVKSRQDKLLLWRTAKRIDSRIEPITCGVKQWEEDDSSAIIEMRGLWLRWRIELDVLL